MIGDNEIEKMRGVVRDCVSKHLYSSAIFFADKVAAFTSDPADIYMQAQALFLGRHFRRAFHLLNASQIVLRDLRFRYLAAKCLVSLFLFVFLIIEIAPVRVIMILLFRYPKRKKKNTTFTRNLHPFVSKPLLLMYSELTYYSYWKVKSGNYIKTHVSLG